jgi:hypothetical protein
MPQLMCSRCMLENAPTGLPLIVRESLGLRGVMETLFISQNASIRPLDSTCRWNDKRRRICTSAHPHIHTSATHLHIRIPHVRDTSAHPHPARAGHIRTFHSPHPPLVHQIQFLPRTGNRSVPPFAQLGLFHAVHRLLQK